MIRPRAPPPTDTAVKRPSARTRSRGSLNIVVSSAREDGAASAAPTPCRARAASRKPPLGAKPPSSEARMNTPMPAMKVRRRPRRSPARAPSSSRPPKVSV